MSGSILYANYTDTGGRPCNEDTVDHKWTGQDHLCVVLADGLGGHGGGKSASQEAVKTILESWEHSFTPNDLCDLILDAHRQVLALQTPVCRMKTTVVVLAVEPERAIWAHVGDSRLYHFLDGKLIFQTRDHSASQIAVLMNQIRPEEIRFHEDRSHIFRALGQENGLSVDTQEQPLSPGRHAFLLCSDGFWEYVYEKEMEEDLHLSASPEDWLERMRARLGSRAGQDNDNNTAAAVWLTV
ncbi:MAG: serine/threonine-protein phosphatase [Blautia sp.]|nr:serine/threonine-protein phosphatase [Blautia sp.]